jgi:hypothetical protein
MKGKKVAKKTFGFYEVSAVLTFVFLSVGYLGALPF